MSPEITKKKHFETYPKERKQQQRTTSNETRLRVETNKANEVRSLVQKLKTMLE